MSTSPTETEQIKELELENPRLRGQITGMIPSEFIEIPCGDSRTIFNAAHIISIEQRELPIVESKRARAKEELGIEGDTAYYISINMSHPEQGREYLCKNKAERDAMFNSLALGLNPLLLTPNGAKRLK